MKLTAIPQLARNANRLREIITILSKYSLADWISRLDLDFARGLFKTADGALPQLTHERRVRLALAELGTTFIKLGQMLSTRDDLVGPALAQELALLQAGAPAEPLAVVRATVERELGRPLEVLFAEFEEKPLASASIGQVHGAQLADGTRVVVKVQHPGIEARIRTDLDIMVGLAQLAENNLEDVAQYRPRATLAEFQRTLLRELDFGREERNLRQFAANFDNDPTVRFPRPLAELCTSRVLTMEFLLGTPLSQPAQLKAQGADLSLLARRGATVFLEMIFRDGFYHADPHPGNILVLPGGVLGLLDCGMVGRLDEVTREDIEELLLAVARGDARGLTSVITRLGSVPPDLDSAGLNADVVDFVSYYGGRPLHRLNLGEALNEMTAIIRQYRILLPTSIALLLKVLVMLEGTSRLLHPQFELMELIRPYQRKLLLRYLSPARRLRKLRRIYGEWESLGRALPRGLLTLLQQLQTNRFQVHLDHKHLDPSVNRLTFGMLTSALFVGSAMMLSAKAPPAVWDISIVGAVGSAISVLQALRLYWAIKNSGRLDQ